MPKAKNVSTDTQVSISGYLVESVRNGGYMSLRMEYGDYDYALPRSYRGFTLHDDNGDEIYVFLPGDSRVKVDGEDDFSDIDDEDEDDEEDEDY